MKTHQGTTSIPPISPPARRRQRSIDTVTALYAAAREMLKEKTLQDLSIHELCARIGMTTGAFYSSFESKEVFFEALQCNVCEERIPAFDALLNDIDEVGISLDEICERFVRYLVSHARRDHGLLRASMLHRPSGREDNWQPFRDLGTQYKEALVIQLAPHLRHLPARERNTRIRFSNQVIFSLIIHAVLNRPGPLALDDASFIVETTRLVTAYLRA